MYTRTETVIQIHGNGDTKMIQNDTKMKMKTKMKIGCRNHWITFKLLSVFFNVAVLVTPKYQKRENIYCYIHQT